MVDASNITWEAEPNFGTIQADSSMSDRAPTSGLGRVALAPWLFMACSGDVVEGMTSVVYEAGSSDSGGAGESSSSGPPEEPSQLPECGDGVVHEGEDCDGDDLGELTCQSLGFEDGIVTCSPNCRAITNACWTCGDEQLHVAETCDGTLLGGATCQSQGFAGGTLKCADDCRSHDTSSCEPFASCGNGVLDPGEQCDGNDLGQHTCQSQGFDNGELACSVTCVLNTSGCGYDPLDCTTQGDFCWSDSQCCPPGVGGNFAGKCYGFCT